MIPKQLSSGVIELQSAAVYSLYLPAGWPVAKVGDCQFVRCGSPRFASKPRRVVVNLVTAGEAEEFPRPGVMAPSGRLRPMRAQTQKGQGDSPRDKKEVWVLGRPPKENFQAIYWGEGKPVPQNGFVPRIGSHDRLAQDP